MIQINLLYNIITGILIGSSITGIFYIINKKNNIKKYNNHYATYEQKLYTIAQNLKNESNLHHNYEEKLKNEQKIICDLCQKLSATEERLKSLDYYKNKCEQLNHELDTQININHSQELKLQEFNIRLEEHKLSIEEKHKSFINNEKKLMIQFENLANRIFNENSNKINTQNKSILDNILYSFKENIEDFKNKIEQNFSKEEKIHNQLNYEIKNLYQLSSKITQETVNLTQALKGNSKIQGNWGEIILTRALEASGMREGHEFHLQIGIKQSNGRKLQPDVIIHLPREKYVIIDSKISLVAYERYFNNNNLSEKKEAMTDHIHSLRSHLISLSKKDYQKLFGINTLDYILMFVPIESALILAIETEPSLLTDAIKHNIMLVSPTTLLIALRTINNLWNHERQHRYSQKISEKAGRLYDKLKLFMDDLNKIGQYLKKTEIIYNSAKNKFSEGKGNIVSQAESFRSLGVQIKHPITTKTLNLHNNEYLTHEDTCSTNLTSTS